ncbi:5-oxoprolinase subunit PxpB [Sporomusa sp.]|uniref:5-oxoprolinase subunit PxpB n=1 Tax=Sporomusa sp. TaxID=2078658 RepID=UPI0039C95A24
MAECQSAANMVPFGETAIMIEFGQGIHPDLHRKVKAVSHYLDQYPFPGMVEYVAAFASVTVFYDPIRLNSETVAAHLQDIVSKLEQGEVGEPRVVEIPVCYGGEFGPDLEFVAQHNGLTIDEVIEIHTGSQYLVYMLGFAPGFPYLGGMSERIAAPRRQSPRPAIPAGTVGIAGMQTGVYPITTPGGWQLIGCTPLELFCPNDNPPTLLRSGDSIQFRPICPKEYRELKGAGQ